MVNCSTNAIPAIRKDKVGPLRNWLIFVVQHGFWLTDTTHA